MSAHPQPEDFVRLPERETITLHWPTPNHFLFTAPERYFARTRMNPDYGRPGWTRDSRKRFHRGCDIAATKQTATGSTSRVTFTDPATGRDVVSDEPAFVPHDEIFAVADGVVCEACSQPDQSDFGNHVILKHRWPKSQEPFFTLYAHMDKVSVSLADAVRAGQRLGTMGRTSRIHDARNWMAVTPHLHFEALDAHRRAFNPELFLRAFLPNA